MKSVVAALAGLFVFAVAAPAFAHVEVSSSDASQGGYAVLDFQVPDESDTASTTKVSIELPPFASVSVRPLAGWTATTHDTKLAKPLVTDDGDKVTSSITRIDWTAAGANTAIKPGQFQEFTISVGPLPDADSVSFGAVQTYSDGTTVLWNQQAAPGAAEPAHPKPTLRLASADPTSADPASAPKAASTTAPTVLSIVALVVAAAALGLVVVGNARRRG